MVWTTRPFFWHRLTWSAQVFSFFWYWRSLHSPWNPWSSLVRWFLPGLFLRRTKPNQSSQESPIVSIIILLDGYSCSDHFFRDSFISIFQVANISNLIKKFWFKFVFWTKLLLGYKYINFSSLNFPYFLWFALLAFLKSMF